MYCSVALVPPLRNTTVLKRLIVGHLKATSNF